MEATQHREPWNKGKLVGQKPPLKPKDFGVRPLSAKILYDYNRPQAAVRCYLSI